VLEGQSGPYLLLDRTFNPAGVPNPDNRSNLIVSLFEPREKQQGQQHQAVRQRAPHGCTLSAANGSIGQTVRATLAVACSKLDLPPVRYTPIFENACTVRSDGTLCIPYPKEQS
jgi:hypothetical protein